MKWQKVFEYYFQKYLWYHDNYRKLKSENMLISLLLSLKSYFWSRLHLLKSFYQWVKFTNDDGMEFQSQFNLLQGIITIKYSFAMFGILFIALQSFEQVLNWLQESENLKPVSSCSKLWNTINCTPNIAKEYLIMIIARKRLNRLWNSILSPLVSLTHW